MGDDEPRTTGYQRSEMVRPIQDPSVVAIQMNMDQAIDRVEHLLRGEKWNYTSQDWERGKFRAISDEGIDSLMTYPRAHLTPNTYLANFDEDKIFKIMRPMHMEITDLIIEKQEEWEIEDAYRKFIVTILTNPIYFAMTRGLYHLTLDSLSQGVRITEAREVEKRHSKIPFFG